MTISFDERREIGTERIGTLLLQGWVLTDQPCENLDCGMIYMRKKDNSVTEYCVLCSGIDPILPECFKKEESVVQIDVSKLMGEKLLNGWTMLQECCDKCLDVPLMRSKQMDLICVKCNCSEQSFVNVDASEDDEIDQLLNTVKVETFEQLKTEDFKKENLGFIHQTLLAKLTFLRNELEASKSFSEIQLICSALESCTKALKEIHNF